MRVTVCSSLLAYVAVTIVSMGIFPIMMKTLKTLQKDYGFKQACILVDVYRTIGYTFINTTLVYIAFKMTCQLSFNSIKLTFSIKCFAS